jgi:hypothetical protein
MTKLLAIALIFLCWSAAVTVAQQGGAGNPAQFSVDGRTSTLKGPAGVPHAWGTRMRSTTRPTDRCSS